MTSLSHLHKNKLPEPDTSALGPAASTPTAAVTPTSRPLPYTHDAMIDLIIASPDVTTEELATLFSYSQSWIRRVLSSDSFCARLADRKAALIDPGLTRTLNQQLAGVTTTALSAVAAKLDSPDVSADFALDALGLAVNAIRSGHRLTSKGA